MEVVGDGVVVDLAQRTLLRANGAREVPEMVHRQWNVGVERLADRLAVVPRLRDGDRLEILLDAVRDLVQDHGPLGR